jgi:oligoribonuclease
MTAPPHADAALVWVDLEMTGLDPDACVIVEVAVLVTGPDLEIRAEGPDIVIHQPESALSAMAPVVAEMHARSGLTAAVRASTVTLAQAEAQVLSFLTQHTPPRTAPLCGNSVWKDKQFLEKYMPRVMNHLHYRIVDVSSIKELARRWYPDQLRGAPPKNETHRALDDIKESIEELRFYRRSVFR